MGKTRCFVMKKAVFISMNVYVLAVCLNLKRRDTKKWNLENYLGGRGYGYVRGEIFTCAYQI